MIDKEELERAWPAREPPDGFADRVLQRLGEPVASALAERSHVARERSWRRGIARWKLPVFGALALSACAALWVARGARLDRPRDWVAEVRREVRLDRRAVSVLEPGAHLALREGRFHQDRGDVFYRVEPGEPFVVETPAGRVTVLGTCFRIRLRTPGAEAGAGVSPAPGKDDVSMKPIKNVAGGALLGAAAVVIVYEGRVQLSHAESRLELGAGEAGALGPNGAEKLEGAELAELERARWMAPAAPVEAAELRQRDEGLLRRDLADVSGKLKLLEAEKGALATELRRVEAELARRTSGETPRERNDFDLDQEDWKQLAQQGAIKYRMPCQQPDGWLPGERELDGMGLAPQDGEVIQAAYKRSYGRLWGALRPLCVEAIGSAQVVDEIGADTCTHLILNMAYKADAASAKAAMIEVAETRAGLRAPPAPGTTKHPVFELFWALSGEMPALEADLAESFGPEDAKRIAYDQHMCSTNSTFGKPR